MTPQPARGSGGADAPAGTSGHRAGGGRGPMPPGPAKTLRPVPPMSIRIIVGGAAARPCPTRWGCGRRRTGCARPVQLAGSGTWRLALHRRLRRHRRALSFEAASPGARPCGWWDRGMPPRWRLRETRNSGWARRRRVVRGRWSVALLRRGGRPARPGAAGSPSTPTCTRRPGRPRRQLSADGYPERRGPGWTRTRTAGPAGAAASEGRRRCMRTCWRHRSWRRWRCGAPAKSPGGPDMTTTSSPVYPGHLRSTDPRPRGRHPARAQLFSKQIVPSPPTTTRALFTLDRSARDMAARNGRSYPRDGRKFRWPGARDFCVARGAKPWCAACAP